MKQKIDLKFKKGITCIHVPFQSKWGSHDELHQMINKFDVPKSTRIIEASIACHINLKHPELSFDDAEVRFMR